MAVSPVPQGYHTITPYLLVPDATRYLEFLGRAFDAVVVQCLKNTDGTIKNAEVRIGDSMIMVSEKPPNVPMEPMCFYLYLPDVDAAYARLIAAGAKSIMPPMDHFYGDRSGGAKDETGTAWWVASRKENLSEEELTRMLHEHESKRATRPSP